MWPTLRSRRERGWSASAAGSVTYASTSKEPRAQNLAPTRTGLAAVIASRRARLVRHPARARPSRRGTPDPTEPWIPGQPTLTVYELDARINGVSEEYGTEVTVEGADQLVIASPKAMKKLP